MLLNLHSLPTLPVPGRFPPGSLLRHLLHGVWLRPRVQDQLLTLAGPLPAGARPALSVQALWTPRNRRPFSYHLLTNVALSV